MNGIFEQLINGGMNVDGNVDENEQKMGGDITFEYLLSNLSNNELLIGVLTCFSNLMKFSPVCILKIEHFLSSNKNQYLIIQNSITHIFRVAREKKLDTISDYLFLVKGMNCLTLTMNAVSKMSNEENVVECKCEILNKLLIDCDLLSFYMTIMLSVANSYGPKMRMYVELIAKLRFDACFGLGKFLDCKNDGINRVLFNMKSGHLSQNARSHLECVCEELMQVTRSHSGFKYKEERAEWQSALINVLYYACFSFDGGSRNESNIHVLEKYNIHMLLDNLREDHKKQLKK